MLVHSTTSMYIVFQSVDKLLTRPHWVDVRNQRVFPNKTLCQFDSTVNSSGIRVDCVCGNSFMPPGDIEGRAPGLEVPFHGEGAN